MSDLALDPAVRLQLWQRMATEIERYLRQVASAPVAPVLDPAALRRELAAFDFSVPIAPLAALETAVNGFWRHQVHTPHPRYFGLFNPAPATMGIAADALVAAFNPQIAAWSHNPFAAEIERHLIRSIAGKFGYPNDADGVFTSGGAEANHTALLCALTHAYPGFLRQGARAFAADPVIYVSSQSHDSVLKSAGMCGLGTNSVRVLDVDDSLRFSPAAVEQAVTDDRRCGAHPLLLVATAGTTGTGMIDPIAPLGDVARAAGMWFHVDAAWGGFAALLPELRSAMAGIEQADSITFDAHKSLSVPMGAGMFLTRRPDILSRTFAIHADYMPRDAAGVDAAPPDPFAHSMQWSRRAIGLKLFLSLAVAGWPGYEAALRHQVAMGVLLKQLAVTAGWQIANDTPLPLASLTDPRPGGDREEWLGPIVRAAVASGEVWVSLAKLPRGRSAIRACITNYRTQAGDVQALLASLQRART